MPSYFGRFSLCVLLAAGLAGGVALAQQPPTPADPPAPPAPAEATAPVTPAAPTAPAVVQAETKTGDEAPALRRIDEPAAPEAPVKKRRTRSERGTSEPPFGDHRVAKDSSVSEAVSIFGSTDVDGEVRSDAVSVLGSTRVGPAAKVGGAAVAVLGNLSVEGAVKGEAVGVLGNVYVNAPVGGEVVSVLGQLELGPQAVVAGDVVAVGGKVKRHPEAIVRGQTVNVPILGSWGAVDWLVTWFKRCVLLGRPLAFGEHLGWAWLVAGSFLGLYLLLALLFPRGLERCVTTFETRPGYTILASILTVFLSPVVTLLLAVTVIGLAVVPFMGIAFFAASLFGKAVMLAWLGRRLMGPFGGARTAVPVVAVLVGGGLVLLLYTVPFLGFLLYKLLSWLGLGVVVYTFALAMKREKPAAAPAAGGAPGAGGGGAAVVPPPPPAPAPAPAAVAATPVAPAGEAPVVGPQSSLGFVGGTSAAMNLPAAPVVQSAPVEVMPPVDAGTAPGAGTPPPVVPAGPLASSGFVGDRAAASGAAASAGAGVGGVVPPPVPPVPPPPAYVPPPVVPQPPVATLPRAGFGIRLAAMFLDFVIIGIGTGLLNGLLPRFMQIEPPAILLLLATYGAVMWKNKGTTIGGVVCGLKVVRLDDRPMDWTTAWVRAGSCFLSMAVAGLGFLWVIFDEERQSWHDKIAGTTVVRMPKGVPLI